MPEFPINLFSSFISSLEISRNFPYRTSNCKFKIQILFNLVTLQSRHSHIRRILCASNSERKLIDLFYKTFICNRIQNRNSISPFSNKMKLNRFVHLYQIFFFVIVFLLKNIRYTKSSVGSVINFQSSSTLSLCATLAPISGTLSLMVRRLYSMTSSASLSTAETRFVKKFVYSFKIFFDNKIEKLPKIRLRTTTFRNQEDLHIKSRRKMTQNQF